MLKKQINHDIAYLILAVISMLVIGASIFSVLEGWSFLNALYFVTVTSATIGYGDLTPTTYLSKIFTIIYALSIIPFILYAFTAIAQSQMEKVYLKIHQLEKKQKEQERELNEAERKLRRQKTLIRLQEEELEKQQISLKKQFKSMSRQKQEIDAHDRELEIVENLMEEALVK